MSYSKTLAIAAASLAIVGCATPYKEKGADDFRSAPHKPLSVEERMVAAAESSTKALNELLLIESSTATPTKPVSNKAPAGLASVANVKWSGPIEQFLADVVSHSVGYQFSVRGKAPAIPVIVSVDVKNVSLFELIRNAGVQSGHRANVIVDPVEKMVILEYVA